MKEYSNSNVEELSLLVDEHGSGTGFQFTRNDDSTYSLVFDNDTKIPFVYAIKSTLNDAGEYVISTDQPVLCPYSNLQDSTILSHFINSRSRYVKDALKLMTCPPDEEVTKLKNIISNHNKEHTLRKGLVERTAQFFSTLGMLLSQPLTTLSNLGSHFDSLLFKTTDVLGNTTLTLAAALQNSLLDLLGLKVDLLSTTDKEQLTAAIRQDPTILDQLLDTVLDDLKSDLDISALTNDEGTKDLSTINTVLALTKESLIKKHVIYTGDSSIVIDNEAPIRTTDWINTLLKNLKYFPFTYGKATISTYKDILVNIGDRLASLTTTPAQAAFGLLVGTWWDIQTIPSRFTIHSATTLPKLVKQPTISNYDMVPLPATSDDSADEIFPVGSTFFHDFVPKLSYSIRELTRDTTKIVNGLGIGKPAGHKQQDIVLCSADVSTALFGTKYSVLVPEGFKDIEDAQGAGYISTKLRHLLLEIALAPHNIDPTSIHHNQENEKIQVLRQDVNWEKLEKVCTSLNYTTHWKENYWETFMNSSSSDVKQLIMTKQTYIMLMKLAKQLLLDREAVLRKMRSAKSYFSSGNWDVIDNTLKPREFGYTIMTPLMEELSGNDALTFVIVENSTTINIHLYISNFSGNNYQKVYHKHGYYHFYIHGPRPSVYSMNFSLRADIRLPKKLQGKSLDNYQFVQATKTYTDDSDLWVHQVYSPWDDSIPAYSDYSHKWLATMLEYTNDKRGLKLLNKLSYSHISEDNIRGLKLAAITSAALTAVDVLADVKFVLNASYGIIAEWGKAKYQLKVEKDHKPDGWYPNKLTIARRAAYNASYKNYPALNHSLTKLPILRSIISFGNLVNILSAADYLTTARAEASDAVKKLYQYNSKLTTITVDKPRLRLVPITSSATIALAPIAGSMLLKLTNSVLTKTSGAAFKISAAALAWIIGRLKAIKGLKLPSKQQQTANDEDAVITTPDEVKDQLETISSTMKEVANNTSTQSQSIVIKDLL